MLASRVASGDLPPVDQRLPSVPSIVSLDQEGQKVGRHGGELEMLVARSKDIRYMVVYGYARLVAYDADLVLQPDILQSFQVSGGREFTFALRPGHKWSDGAPFTTEDFRYWWEDVANNPDLSPSGPPVNMLVDGKPPKVEILSETEIRFTWAQPNPQFLPRLAGASPLFIYRPAHYLKQFHSAHADAEQLDKAVEQSRARNWAALHNRRDNMYKFDNPDLPTLQPWRNTTRPPAARFVGKRNPYYHRIDGEGRQLPYIDRLIFSQATGALIPAQAASGAADLQINGLALSDVPFLKQNEERIGYQVRLWKTAKGSHFALYPNLNINDPAWRTLFRDVRFRRALSLAIDRRLINRVIYFGLALEGNNTALPGSHFYDETMFRKWATYDPGQANRLLDEIGLARNGTSGIRQLADGRNLEIIVESAGEGTETTDVLELIQATWREVGIALFVKPVQREVFRNRVFSGQTQISVWTGFENGVPTPAFSPAELAPTRQQSLQWSKWGQFFETGGGAGEAPDMDVPKQLLALNTAWLNAADDKRRAEIWREMLSLHADQQFIIGVVGGVPQPLLVGENLHNVPADGFYNWDPGALIGIYRPDTFWLELPQ